MNSGQYCLVLPSTHFKGKHEYNNVSQHLKLSCCILTLLFTFEAQSFVWQHTKKMSCKRCFLAKNHHKFHRYFSSHSITCSLFTGFPSSQTVFKDTFFAFSFNQELSQFSIIPTHYFLDYYSYSTSLNQFKMIESISHDFTFLNFTVLEFSFEFVIHIFFLFLL